MNILITIADYNTINLRMIGMRCVFRSSNVAKVCVAACASILLSNANAGVKAESVKEVQSPEDAKLAASSSNDQTSEPEEKDQSAAFAESRLLQNKLAAARSSATQNAQIANSALSKKHRMSLKDVIAYAYANNPELRAALADKQAKDEMLAQAFSEYYPDIFVKLSAGRTHDRSTSEVNVRHRVPTLDNYTATNTSASVVLSQNIFKGWGTKYKLEAAEASVIANRHVLSAKIQDILMKIVNAYMNLWESEQLVVISEKLRNNLSKSLESEKKKLEVGVSNLQEYEAKRSAHADAQYKLSEAISRYKSALAEFKMVTCMDATGSTELPKFPLDFPKGLDSLVREAAVNNPSLLASKFEEYAAVKQSKVSKSELAPRVDFELSAESDLRNHYSRRWRPDSMKSFNALNGRQPDNRHYAMSAKFNVTVPILREGGRQYSTIRQSNQAALKAAFEYKAALYKVEQECRGAWSVYTAAIEQIEQSNRAVESASITVEGFRRSEELGKVSSTDVIYNERNLLDRRQQAVEARKKLILASYRILLCEGKLEDLVRSWNVRTYDTKSNEKKVRHVLFFE